MKVGLALLAALLISTVTLQPAHADGSLSELFRDDANVLDSDSLTVEVLEPSILAITVEQRLFNRAGNEQRGLRAVSELSLDANAQYLVPDAGPGYRNIPCDEVGATSEQQVVNSAEDEGQGTFTASTSGVHLACYQQVPGTRLGPSPGPPGAEEPEVLGIAFEQGGGGENGDATVVNGVLARTESETVPVGPAVLGLILFVGIAVGPRWKGTTTGRSFRSERTN